MINQWGETLIRQQYNKQQQQPKVQVKKSWRCLSHKKITVRLMTRNTTWFAWFDSIKKFDDLSRPNSVNGMPTWPQTRRAMEMADLPCLANYHAFPLKDITRTSFRREIIHNYTAHTLHTSLSRARLFTLKFLASSQLTTTEEREYRQGVTNFRSAKGGKLTSSLTTALRSRRDAVCALTSL